MAAAAQAVHDYFKCLDLVFNHKDADGDDSKPLQERINRQHGTYIIPYAEQLGLGTSKYVLIDIDKKQGSCCH